MRFKLIMAIAFSAFVYFGTLFGVALIVV